jgi:hypothetical protein
MYSSPFCLPLFWNIFQSFQHLSKHIYTHIHTRPRVVTGEKNSPTVAHACRKRRLKWVLGAWVYNWATQSPGDINIETWSYRLGVGRGADDSTPEKVNS